MSKSSIVFSELQAPGVPVPDQGLWPRVREVGAAWMHRLVEAQRNAVRGCLSPALGFDNDMPAEFGRLPRRLWQRHSAYLVYGHQARTLGPALEDVHPQRRHDVEATGRGA